MKTTKALACAIFATLALSGIGASTASAAKFLAGASPVNFFGAQEVTGPFKFEVDGQVAECKNVSMEATNVTTPAGTLNMAPNFGKAGECTVFGFTGEIVPNGCTFEFQEPNGTLESLLAIRCPSGQSIKVFGSGITGTCEVRIGEANNEKLSRLKHSNLGGMPSKFSTKFEISAMTVNKTVDTGVFPGCSLKGTGIVNNATLGGLFPIEGKDGKGNKVSVEVK